MKGNKYYFTKKNPPAISLLMNSIAIVAHATITKTRIELYNNVIFPPFNQNRIKPILTTECYCDLFQLIEIVGKKAIIQYVTPQQRWTVKALF